MGKAETVQKEINQWQDRLRETQAELSRCQTQRTRLEGQCNSLLLEAFDNAKAKQRVQDLETEQVRVEKEHRRLTTTVQQIEGKLKDLDEALSDARDSDMAGEQAALYEKMLKLAPEVETANNHVLKLNEEFAALTVKLSEIDRQRKNKLDANIGFWRFWFETKHHPHVRGNLNGAERRQFQVPLVDLVKQYLGKFFSENKRAA